MTLELCDISFRYHLLTPPVLDGVTVHAEKGRICAIVGPNAAGKSTLLRVILGLYRPQRGTVAIHGRDIHALPPRRRAKLLAYVAQQPTVDAPYSVRDVVALGRFAHDFDAGAVDRALKECDLADLHDELFHELSVGQQQRVALARALAQVDGVDGPVILLDEPMAAMDPHNVAHTAGLLWNQARKHDAVILIVLHDLLAASMIADDAWLMADGRLVAHGPVKDVLTKARLEEIYRVTFNSPDNLSRRPFLPDYGLQ